MQNKFIAIVLYLCVLAVPAKSQVLLSILFGDKLNSDKLSFGLHMDYSWNTISGVQNGKALRTFNLGMFLTYHVNEQWHLNVEPLAKYTRGIKGLAPYDLGNDSLNSLFADGSVERKINYVAIPMSVQYQTRIGLYAEVGPQVSVRVKTYDLFQVDSNDDHLELRRNLKHEISPWDFGWLAGIGYRFGKAQKISGGVRYQGGFSDVMKTAPGNQHHEQWGIYANIPIGATKTTTTK